MQTYTAKNFKGVAINRTAAICSGETKQEALDVMNSELQKRGLGPLQLSDLKDYDSGKAGARILADGRIK